MGGPVRFVRREGSGLFPGALLAIDDFNLSRIPLIWREPINCCARIGLDHHRLSLEPRLSLVIVDCRRTPRVCSSTDESIRLRPSRLAEQGPMATLVYRVHVHTCTSMSGTVNAPSLLGALFWGTFRMCTGRIIMRSPHHRPLAAMFEHLPDSPHGHIMDESRVARGTALLGQGAVHGRCEGRTAGGRRSRECDT